MNQTIVDRHLNLPAGVHPTTGALLTLKECLTQSEDMSHLKSLTDDQRIALVRARWTAGEWSDIHYGTDGLVDLPRAIREIEAKSPMGQHLVSVAIRAIEMAAEDVLTHRKTA